MNQNEPIFLNLYIRDTETRCKNTKNIGNKLIVRIEKLISFYENQHFFSGLFVLNLLSRWLKECFPFFCISYVEIQKNGSFWFILQNSSFYSFFVAYRADSIFALASSTAELLMNWDRFVWWFQNDVPMPRWWRR